MFHQLNEYAKLLRYKPTIPEKAIELCSERIACPAHGSEKKFMIESMVDGPMDKNPCTMLPPSDPHALHLYFMGLESSLKQVEVWENKYWETQNRVEG